MNEINKELFKQPFVDFEEHLSIVNNERIIFSAKYGMGKTTFLKWFFNEQKKDDYNVIHLFPVNYSIASNEDIFRYIKYDIIIELLRCGFEVEENDIEVSEVYKKFFKENYGNIAATIIYMIPQIGKQVIDSYEKIEDLLKTFETTRDKLKDDANEGDKLIDYIEKIEGKEGSVFEDDIISKTIENILERAKGDNKKQNILIVDDLDRIDPEHIFRLLNVFAAHFDRPNKTTRNKFGFDKVIFVCDIANIRELFRHKYGLRVDFNGYLNKFFSNTIFDFDLSSNYAEYIISKLLFVELMNKQDKGRPFTLYNQQYLGVRVKIFLDVFIDNKLFDLRNSVKWEHQKLNYQYYWEVENIGIRFTDYSAMISLKFLRDILGDKRGLSDVVSKLKGSKVFRGNDPRYARDRACGELILFLAYDDKSIGENGIIRYEVGSRICDFIYTLSDRHYTIKEIKGVNTPENFIEMTDDDFLELLEKAIKFMDSNYMFR